jgi:hypothetical protein
MKLWGVEKYWPRNVWLRAGAIVFLAGLFLALASFLFGDFCGQQKEGCYGDYASNNIAYVAIARAVEFLELHNALITAVATALLTVITWRLARLESESGETRKAELRPYFSVSAKGISLSADGRIFAYVEIKNAGQTPAFNIFAPSTIVLCPPPPHKFDVGSIPITPEVLADLGSVTLPKEGSLVITPERFIPYAEVIAALSRSERFYVSGMIHCKNVFQEKQTDKFTMFLEPNEFGAAYIACRNTPGEVLSLNFRVAEFGNGPDLRHLPG